MKVIRISDDLAERLDAIRDSMASAMSLRYLNREQQVGILLDKGVKEVEQEQAAEG